MNKFQLSTSIIRLRLVHRFHLEKQRLLLAGDNLNIADSFREWIKAERRNFGHREVNDEDDTIYNKILQIGSCNCECEEFDKDVPILMEEMHEPIAQLDEVSKVTYFSLKANFTE